MRSEHRSCRNHPTVLGAGFGGVIRRTLHGLITGFALCSCAGASASFMPASQRNFPAKPRNCFVEVLSRPPQRSYEQIGTFELRRTSSLEEVRAVVTPEACARGVDAVVVDSAKRFRGFYGTAAAIRWTDSDADRTNDK